MTDSLESKKKHSEEKHRTSLGAAVYQRITPHMKEGYRRVRSDDQGVRLVALHENLVKSSQSLVAQGIVKTVSAQLFVFKLANWSSQQTLILINMEVAACLKTSASCKNSQDTSLQKQGESSKDCVNATQM